MNAINYQDPLQEDSHFQDYLKSKGEALKSSSRQQIQRPQSTHIPALLFVLMIGIVVLGSVALLQYRENQELLSRSKNPEVAGINDDVQKNIVTAYGFSLIFDTPLPEGFSLKQTINPSPYLTDTQAITTTFQAELKDDDKTLLAGIEVSVSEFDNKRTNEEFASLVQSQLGGDYTILSSPVIIPNNYSAISIKHTSPTTDGIDYYTIVTSSNYYSIKVINQVANESKYEDYALTIDSIIQKLYLN